MSFEQLAAISAKVAERTREDGSTIGNAIKTIITRTSTVGKMPEYEDEVDNETLSKAAESLSKVGIEVYKTNGEMNDIDVTISKLREKWDDLTDAQQSNIAFNIAATRQTSKFKNILEAWDESMALAETASTAEGNALANQEKYEESMVGKMQQMQSQLDEFWIHFYNSDAVNGILDFLVNVTKGINDLSDAITPLGALLTGIGATGIFGGLGKTIFGGIKSSIVGGLIKPYTMEITQNTVAQMANAVAAGKLTEAEAAKTVAAKLGRYEMANQTMATIQNTVAEEANAVAAQKMAAAHNLMMGIKVAAIIAGIVIAVAAAKKAYDELSMSTDALVKRNDRLIKEDKEKLKSLQDEKKGYDDNAKALSDLLSRYQEAEVGSEEYYNIRQQIADQFPELITGYDSEGRAIIATNDQIQIQIDKYKELSLAKQEALKDQARENIDREVGKTKTWGVGDNNRGQESLKELRENRKNLEKEKERIEREYASNGGKKIQTDNKGERTWASTLETDEEYQQILTDLANVTGQIDEARAQLHESYTLLVGQIDEDNVELINATTGLEQFAEKAELDAGTFENAFLKLKYSDLSKEGGITEIFNKLLSPDYTEIDATDYANTMRDYVNQIIDEFNLEDVIKASDVYDAFDISKTQDYINKSFDDIYNAYQANATKLGIDLGEWRKTAKVSDILGFNWQDFASEPAIEQFKTRYKKFFDDLQEESVTSLSSMDFEKEYKRLESYNKKYSLNKFGVAGISTAFNQKGAFNQTFADLHNMQAELRKLGIVTSEGNQAYLDTIELLSQYADLADDTAEGLTERFAQFKSDTDTAFSSMSTSSEKLTTALSEQSKQGYISADSYKELISANSNYKDAIIETATGLQLNKEKVKELQNQEKADLAKNLQEQRQALGDEYEKNQAKITELSQKLRDHNYAEEESAVHIANQIAALNESQSVIQQNISAWQEYRDELLGATSAWTEWQNAVSGTNAMDQYDTVQGWLDTYKQLQEKGRVGREDYQAFGKFLTGETDSDVLASEEFYNAAYKVGQRYFTEDRTGMDNAAADIQAALKEAGLNDWFNDDGSINIKNDALLNKIWNKSLEKKGFKQGLSLEAQQAILSGMPDMYWGNPEEQGTYADQMDWAKESLADMYKLRSEVEKGSQDWKDYTEMIKDAKDQIQELEILSNTYKNPEELTEANQAVNKVTTTQVDIPTSFTSAEQAQRTLDQLMQQKAEIDVELNPEEYEACLAEIEYVTGQLMDLEKPVTIDVQAEGLTDAQREAGILIEKIQEAEKARVVATNSGNTSGAAKAQEIGDNYASQLQQLQQQHPEMEIGITLEKGTLEEAMGELTSHSEEIKNAFKIDNDVLAPVQDSLNKVGSKADEAKGKVSDLGTQITSTPLVGSLGFPSLNGWIYTANKNVGRLKTAIDNLKDKTVKVRVQTSNTATGSTGAQGTTKFHPFGKAAARGDMGAKKTETALVGELGPEMRVRGSRWELLGENGAEFADVRKGDIIFNHKQTDELLKNGYISSRGQMAYAGGTAFVGKFNPTNNTSIKSSSTTTKTKDKTTSKSKSKSSDSDKDTKSKESKLQKWLGKLFDWIEVKIDRTQKAIDNAISKAESYVSMIPATLDRITTGANGLFDANRYKETADEVARYVAKAIGQYTNALSSTYSQISTQNQAVTKYESLASTARKKGLSGLSSKNKKTAKKALKILDKDGTIDVSKYNDKVKEVIEGVKQWKDKAIEARAAINDLNDKVRDYVKSLKETVDAQRDAHTSLAEWSVSSVNATFEATNDNNAEYSASRLGLESNQLKVQNQAYSQATTTMSGQVTSIGKTASKVGMYDGLSKKQKKKLKKNTKGKKAYTTALNNAKTAITNQREIALSDLDTIQKYNPTVYAKMIAWNEALNQLDITRQEEITAYTQNYNKIAENIVEKYNKMDEATNNDIELYTKQIDNATSDKGKNKLLQDQINKSQELRSHAQSRVTEFSGLKGESASAINKYNAKSIRTSKYMNNSDSSTINALFNRIQSTVNSGKAISASDLNTVFELYRKGYIQAGYYQACTNWNISVERLEEAKRAQLLVEETVRQENATRELQKIQNIQQQSENNRQMNEQRKTEANARISKAEAYGHYAKPEDYTAQIEKENSNLQDLIAKREEARQTLHKAVEVGNIRIGDDEWYEAVNVINSMTNAINETDLSVKNLKNSLRQLNWDIFDDGMKEIAKLNTEIEHYLNIIGNEQFFDEDDRGNITQYGLAALEAHNTAYELNIQQAQKYAQEVEELQKRFKLAKEDENWLDSTDAKNQERLQELLEQEWQLVEATEAEKQAIIGLVKQGYDAQLSALNTSISKYKELKQAEKDAYDYQKKITDQTKNILSLEKQLAAFEANSSAESVATVQKLRADLDEAKQQVKDDQYDMYMSEMNNMLDDLSNNFQEWIDYYMKDRDRVLNDAKEYLAGSIDDLGNRSGMANAVTTFKESAVKLIGETNTDVTNISNNLLPLLEANQAVKTKVETIATGVSTIIGEFQKMVKEQSQPMVQGLDTLIATANDEASYQKQVAQNASTGSSKGTTILTPEQERKQAEEARLRAEQERQKQEEEENRRRWLAEQERIKDEEARMKAEYEAKKAEDQQLAKLEAESKKAGTYIKSIATSTTVSAKANAISAKKMSGSAAAAALAGAKLGFKKGSRRISENQWAWTQEDGTEAIYRKSDNALLTPLGAGDKVFTAGMTDNLWKLAKMNLPEMISNSFKQPIVSNSNTNARTNGGDVQFIFNLPGVKDYDSFKSALIADKNFQNAVQTMTLGAASGKNSLSKFKYS